MDGGSLHQYVTETIKTHRSFDRNVPINGMRTTKTEQVIIHKTLTGVYIFIYTSTLL